MSHFIERLQARVVIPAERNLRFLKTVVVVLLAGMAALAGYYRWFQGQELAFYDLRMKVRSPQPVSEKIVIIEISDDTLTQLKRWPIPRRFHAVMVNILKELGVRRVIFDFLFAEPTSDDEIFAAAVQKAGNVYLPSAYELNVSPAGKKRPVVGDDVVGELVDPLKEAIAKRGHINMFLDEDGKARRLPLYVRHARELVPHVAFSAAMDEMGVDWRHLKRRRDVWVIGGRLTIPVSDHGSFWVNYPGPWVETFRHVSYLDVLRAYSQQQQGGNPGMDLDLFKDKTCFIGLTATGTADIKANPYENAYPMVGLQASVFNGLVSGRFIWPVPAWMNAMIAVVIFLLSLGLGLAFAPVRSFLASILAMFVYTAAAFWVFDTKGIWMDLFLPLTIMMTVYVGTVVRRFVREWHQRQGMEKELEIAEKIQRSFLPQQIKSYPDVQIEVFMASAKFVAGDFYDVMELDKDRVGIFIGDVCGKGVPASLIMVQTLSLFRIFVRQSEDPVWVMDRLNLDLSHLLDGRFVTASYFMIDRVNKTVRAVSAGHPPALVYSAADGQIVQFAEASAPPLGLAEGMSYEIAQRAFAPGDKLLIYTDGLLEARNRREEEFGLEKTRDLFARNKELPAGQILDKFKQTLGAFAAGRPAHDDVTMIVVGF